MKIETVFDMRKSINRNEKRIKKGMIWIDFSRLCPKCHAYVPKYSRKCPNCGIYVKRIHGKMLVAK